MASLTRCSSTASSAVSQNSLHSLLNGPQSPGAEPVHTHSAPVPAVVPVLAASLLTASMPSNGVSSAQMLAQSFFHTSLGPKHVSHSLMSSFMQGPATASAHAIAPMEFGEPLVFDPILNGSCEAAVIWLHGLGDKPQSWAKTLKQVRETASPRCKWVFLRAPKLSQPFKHGVKMPAWGKFHRGDCMHVGSKDHEDPDLEAFYQSAVEGVRRVIHSLMLEDGVPPGNIMIGGFSQGAAVSLQAVLSFPELFGGCIILSGWLTSHARTLLEGGVDSVVPPILLCHGLQDDSVGFDCAEFAFAHLHNAKAKVQFERFIGLHHSSNFQEIQAVARFVDERLSGLSALQAHGPGENTKLAAARAAALQVAESMAARLSPTNTVSVGNDMLFASDQPKCAHPECTYLVNSNPKISALYCCEKCEGLHKGEKWAFGGKRHYKSCERIEIGALSKRRRII